MAQLEFEALLEGGKIRIPQAIADQLPEGEVVRVSITPVQQPVELSADDAWDAIVEFIDSRMATDAPEAPYQWKREDAYEPSFTNPVAKEIL